MKRLIGVSLLAVVVATSAQGADLPRYELPGTEVSNSVNWTGFSIGVQGGVLNGNHEAEATAFDEEGGAFPLVNLDGLSSTGLFGRATLQGDVQMGNWVAGLRGHYGFSNAETTLDVPIADYSAELVRGDDYGSTARLGYLLGSENRTLLYALGGWQWSEYEFSDTDGNSQTEKYDGALAGLGIEHALNDHLYVGVEYNHWFAGEATWIDTEGFTLTDDLSEDTVAVSARLKF